MNFGGGFFGILILLLQKYITDFLLILCYFKKYKICIQQNWIE